MKEIRIANLTACEQRANNRDGEEPAGSDPYVLEGIPVVYDTETVIETPAGSYKEIIRRGALDHADLSDSRLLVNHDASRVPLARTGKTMTLTNSPARLKMRAVLPDTQTGKEVYTAVKRGDLSGMSFAFTVPKGGDEYDAKTNTRTIRQIDKVYEFSIVSFPAYPETSVEARSVIETMDERRQMIIDCNKIILGELL